MKRTSSKFLLILAAVLFPITATAGSYVPKDFNMDIHTKGFKGAKANVTARLDAPVEAVWQAVLDSNNHAGKYPKMKRSFCVLWEHVKDAEKHGLRNGATVKKRYKKDMCYPDKLRQKGKRWTFYLFQEFDYPFPLSDRWVMTEAINDETDIKNGKYSQTGKLIYGRQDIYEFKVDVERHPRHPNQTKFHLYVWSDPGGFIADWMVREATKYIAPRYMEILEQEGQKRARAPSTPDVVK